MGKGGGEQAKGESRTQIFNDRNKTKRPIPAKCRNIHRKHNSQVISVRKTSKTETDEVQVLGGSFFQSSFSCSVLKVQICWEDGPEVPLSKRESPD